MEFNLEDISEILSYYGWDGVHCGTGDWISIRCPFHLDTQASAAVSETGAFVCHGGCDIKGNPINVVMRKEGLDFVGAKRRVEEILRRSINSLSQPTEWFPGRRVSDRGSGIFDRNSSLFPDWFRG